MSSHMLQPLRAAWRHLVHVVPIDWCAKYQGDEKQGLVIERYGDGTRECAGPVAVVSLQFFVVAGRPRVMGYRRGRLSMYTTARPMYWWRAFWVKPDDLETRRARWGLGRVGMCWGVCPEAVPL